MVIATYSQLFGTPLGQQLQAWCQKWGWPLAWALGQPGDDAFDEYDREHRINATVARLLDPVVLGSSTAGVNLTTHAKRALGPFQTAWERVAALNVNASGWGGSLHDWEQLLVNTPLELRVEPLTAGKCEGQRGSRCVGVAGGGAGCVCYPI